MFAPPVMQMLSGERVHLSHGPIDIVLRAWGRAEAVRAAYAAAWDRFGHILPELCDEIGVLKAPMDAGCDAASPVGRRMVEACRPFAPLFLTPMAAVAGAVADELMATMAAAAPITRAYVNDGGDIALRIPPGERLDVGIAGDFTAGLVPGLNGVVRLDHAAGAGGLATSGARGRSFSLGIADSVSVLARDAATADAAATLIANAVDVASAAVSRKPARELDPDSDLGDRLVTVEVGPLTPAEVDAALAAGLRRARGYVETGLVIDAALCLAGHVQVAGAILAGSGTRSERTCRPVARAQGPCPGTTDREEMAP